MLQSTRRRPLAQAMAPLCAGVALLAWLCGGDACGQMPAPPALARLPATGDAHPFGGPRDAPATRLAEFQEELPPASGMVLEEMGYDEDHFPLNFDGCAACGSCGYGCPPVECDTRIGRFFWGFYHAVCCPDPCWRPEWYALADSAFFVDAARPVTQTRLRWDAGVNLVLPDRAEFFWARSGGGGKGPAAIETRLTYHELTHYTEVAHGKFSAFTELPYRSFDAEVNPHAAGIGDLVAGTKSMLLDSELIQITLQMKFITPTGAASKGLGTGHLSIEPSLLVGVNLSPASYFQGQVAQWIPIAGDPDYAGALLHYHASYNRSLLGCPGGVHVIGTMEFSGWSFQDGAYSDPLLGQLQRASNETYLSGGGGLRMVLCNKLDFGFGFAQAFTSNHWAEQLYRSELRVRF